MSPATADLAHTNLPGTDLRVSRVAFGCMSTVANPTYDGIEFDQAVATIHAALDHGMNFIDTAPAYGNGASEELLGRALKGKRDQAVIATKASGQTLTASEIETDCETSLRLLDTDVIDLYQIHWPRRQAPLEETFAAMEKLQAAGKVRYLGVCNFGKLDLEEALGLATIQTNQVIYSMLSRAVEFDVAPRCVEAGVGLLCYSPVAQGLLTGRYNSADEVPVGRARTRHFASSRPEARHTEPGCEEETFAAIAAIRSVSERLDRPMAQVALAWLLHQPGVTSVLAGASRPDQVASNAAAATLQFDEATLAELDAATATVKDKLGSSLDIWATEARTR